MKVIVLTGPESAGKSRLAEALSNEFSGHLVSEYVREYIDLIQRDTRSDDIPLIARQQLQREDAARLQAPELLILDTNLLSNLLWSQTLFGRAPDWLEAELLRRHYDLYLLLSPQGMPWVNDGQRCQPQLSDRQQFYHACHTWLERHQQPVTALGGVWTQRQFQALTEVERLLAR